MQGERYWEIDAARGIAVVTMIVFHSAFDLNFFGVLPLPVSGGFLRMLAYMTASTFIFIVGVSFTISYARAAQHLAGRDLAL
ncbi:MAG TPA: heparan-alpha-glucosaminide N-acetyltransferase domain-containing protein, partial [Methanoculleus sp.]|nr:heparan-alpha-glucosaminide N-acetyltransferase domain-containing protein [Methanoculleus sp.]